MSWGLLLDQEENGCVHTVCVHVCVRTYIDGCVCITCVHACLCVCASTRACVLWRMCVDIIPFYTFRPT